MRRTFALAALLATAALPFTPPAQADDPCATETRSVDEITRDQDAAEIRLLGPGVAHLDGAEKVLRLVAVFRAMTDAQRAVERARLDREAQALKCASARIVIQIGRGLGQ
jgi:hypothetical protein